jgi:hypothetical protein
MSSTYRNEVGQVVPYLHENGAIVEAQVTLTSIDYSHFAADVRFLSILAD